MIRKGECKKPKAVEWKKRTRQAKAKRKVDQDQSSHSSYMPLLVLPDPTPPDHGYSQSSFS